MVVVAAAKRVVEEGEMHDQEEEAVRTLEAGVEGEASQELPPIKKSIQIQDMDELVCM